MRREYIDHIHLQSGIQQRLSAFFGRSAAVSGILWGSRFRKIGLYLSTVSLPAAAGTRAEPVGCARGGTSQSHQHLCAV